MPPIDFGSTDWAPILLFLSLGLLLVNVFRLNVFLVLGSITLNLYIATLEGAPLPILLYGYFAAGAEIVALAAKLIWGTGKYGKNARKRRFVG